jgi:L,D-transpeptidase ErfK/SrfK
MVKGKFLSSIILLLCVSTPIPWINLQQRATATEATSRPVTGQGNTAAANSLDTRLILKLKERRVYVYQGKQVLASYPVAVGKKGWETPKGSFQIIQMVENPTWQNPWSGKIIAAGPKNPLGERWIGFWTDGKNTIGFHGTPNENLIGQAVSHGCVRMRNRDVKALFKQVQMGTPVIVVHQ